MKPVKVLHYFAKRPEIPGTVYINTTSRSSDWSKGLSPFFVGPVELYSGYKSYNVENAWQFSKVYPKHVNENNVPTYEWYNWALDGWTDQRAHRFPMGKGAIPLYSYWKEEKLGYIEARKAIYAPLYSKAVESTEAFKKLQELHHSTDQLVLVDFDGYDHLALGMSRVE